MHGLEFYTQSAICGLHLLTWNYEWPDEQAFHWKGETHYWHVINKTNLTPPSIIYFRKLGEMFKVIFFIWPLYIAPSWLLKPVVDILFACLFLWKVLYRYFKRKDIHQCIRWEQEPVVLRKDLVFLVIND